MDSSRAKINVGNSRITRKIGFNGRATVKYERGPNDERCGTTSVVSWKLIRSVFKLTAADIAGHAQLSTTKIYDRSQDRVTIAEIERVSFEHGARTKLTFADDGKRMSDANLSAAKRDFFSSPQKQPEQISFPLFFFIIVAPTRATKRGLNVTKKGQNWRLQLQKRDDGDKEGMKRLFGGEFPGNGPPGARSVTKEGQTGFFGA